MPLENATGWTGWILRAAPVLSALALLGCQPSIGASCNLSTDCSSTGDRLCDTSQPLGYCTVFNCRANGCPGGAACVATNPAEVGCPYDDRHSPSRFSRQMCLEVCGSDGDCRAGYACLAPEEVGALLLDSLRSEKVCLPATTYEVADASADAVPPVCSVSGPDVPPIEAGPGYEPDGSTPPDAAVVDGGTDAGTDADIDGSAADAGASDAASE